MANKTRSLGVFLAMGLAAGCNSILDVGEPTVVEPEDVDPPDATTGGADGGSVCGDRMVQQGEQCDDGNDDPNDGCDACVRDCGVSPEFLHEDSGHCYRISGDDLQTWDAVAEPCAAWGGELVSLETPEELLFVKNRVTVDTWVGARANPPGGSSFFWLSGEEVMFDPALEGQGDCVKIGGELLEYVKEDCTTALHFICERAPAGP